VPAYVVLNDAELVGIATSRPNTLAELARCKGVGPVRLERWGDEILATLDGADGPDETDGDGTDRDGTDSDGAGTPAPVPEGVQG
jgi:ATP-dependent DNA helicase RecQ